MEWKGMRFLSINRVIKNTTITTTAVMLTIITELSMNDNQNANRFCFFFLNFICSVHFIETNY